MNLNNWCVVRVEPKPKHSHVISPNEPNARQRMRYYRSVTATHISIGRNPFQQAPRSCSRRATKDGPVSNEIFHMRLCSMFCITIRWPLRVFSLLTASRAYRPGNQQTAQPVSQHSLVLRRSKCSISQDTHPCEESRTAASWQPVNAGESISAAEKS